jgi:protein-arginine kinase activator protein McsA
LREKINRLQARLDKMVEYQDYFYREINQIREEIKSLNQSFPEIKPETEIKPQIKDPSKKKYFPNRRCHQSFSQIAISRKSPTSRRFTTQRKHDPETNRNRISKKLSVEI